MTNLQTKQFYLRGVALAIALVTITLMGCGGSQKSATALGGPALGGRSVAELLPGDAKAYAHVNLKALREKQNANVLDTISSASGKGLLTKGDIDGYLRNCDGLSIAVFEEGSKVLAPGNAFLLRGEKLERVQVQKILAELASRHQDEDNPITRPPTVTWRKVNNRWAGRDAKNTYAIDELAAGLWAAGTSKHVDDIVRKFAALEKPGRVATSRPRWLSGPLTQVVRFDQDLFTLVAEQIQTHVEGSSQGLPMWLTKLDVLAISVTRSGPKVGVAAYLSAPSMKTGELRGAVSETLGSMSSSWVMRLLGLSEVFSKIVVTEKEKRFVQAQIAMTDGEWSELAKKLNQAHPASSSSSSLTPGEKRLEQSMGTTRPRATN